MTGAKDRVLHALQTYRLLPLVSLENPHQGAWLANALVEAGLPVLEVTFRSDAAATGIAQARRAQPGILLGAGTVLSKSQGQEALDAGADFIVTPGFNPAVVDWCIEHGVPVFPGVSSTEGIEMARQRELSVLKFFPAGAAGGSAFLKALAGPYQDLRFIPTGGVGVANLPEYLALPNVLACGGSWLVPGDALKRQDADGIRDAVAASRKELP